MTKPYKYELAYIESTGTQYIDTGVNADSNLGIEYKYQLLTLTNEALRFGAIWTDGSSVRRHHTSLVTSSGGNGYYVGKSNYIAICNADTTQTHTYILDAITQKSYMDGVECSMLYPSQTTYEPFDCEMNYWLFARNSNDASIISYASIKIYSFKMYNRDTLVRDYIPVLDFNNIPAMYDKVSGQLFYNQGTGQFKYAIKPYKCEVEYLECTGTGTYTSGQYIDTGLDYFADFEITAKQRESAGMKALGTTTYYCVERENATTNAWRFRNGESTFFTTSLLVTDIHTLKWKNDKVYGDGLELGSFAKTTGTNRMYLFGGATPTDLTRINRYPLQIYACKLWHPTTGELVRDYIPVLDYNDVPCLYDKVSGELFYNQGTGDFLYGREIHEVEYLESTGTQYIDTGIKGNLNTAVNIKYKFPSASTASGSGRVFGSRESSVLNALCIGTYSGTVEDGTKLTLYFSNSNTGSQTITTVTVGDWYYSILSKDELSTNGVQETLPSAATAFTTPNNLKLFGFDNNGTMGYGVVQISSTKIYSSENLVRDYIPAIDENGVGFMFDKVTHTIYDNAGTGAFLYGARITELGSPSLTLRRKLMMMLARGKKKYKPIKYIQSSGTQYIISPIQFYGDNYKIECKFDNSDTPVDTTAFGYQSTGSGIQIMVVGFNNANSTGSIFWNGTATAHTNRVKQNIMQKGLNELVIEANNGTLTYTLNGASPVSYGTYTSFEPQTDNMWIFGNNRASSIGSHQLATMKFYYLRVSQNNEMKANFISVLDPNGVPCVYDTVSETYYYNQGTGDFTYEEWDFTPVDYVYADGNAYINTLCYGNSNTKMEMVFNIAEQSTQNRGSMGSRISANSQLLAIGYGTATLASDFNNSSYSPYRSAITYDLNTKYRVYTSKEKRSITDEATGTVLDVNNTLCTNTMSTGALLLGAETGLSYGHIGNIWAGKIWNDETLIRDYIPVVDGDNRGCFYDKTLNALFYSSGTSDFVGHFIQSGVDYKVVKYITAEQVASSTSTRACPYIDTGLYPSTEAKTRLKCKANLAVATTSYEHYLGGTNAGSRFVVGQAGGSSASKFYFGLGTQNFWTTMNVDTNTHIFELDWATETCKIDGTTWQIPSAGTSTASKPFFINARNTLNYANANRPAGGNNYWWKFWEGNALIYNGIPVIRTSDNKAGLFETVSREFQTTAGTVDYTYTE